jgi:radical SAM superfamily enzyme YgiQ (UPF0313 family)
MLVVPPNSLEERYGYLRYVGTMYPSMGLASIGAVAEALHCQVKVVDCEAMGYSYEELEEEIKSFSPHLIGMQTFCNTVNRALEIARRVKCNISNEIKIVLGGVQATLFPQEYCKNEYVDFVVKGEGEVIFRNLILALENNRTEFLDINGLVWKKQGCVINNKDEKIVDSLDILPFPARHLFALEKYYPSAQIRGRRVFHIVTSRGCPYRCGFCSCHKTFGTTYRFMSTERVIREIKYLKDTYKMDSIHFYDDTLTIHKGRMIDLCDSMIKNKLTLPWACFTRADVVDRELLRKMKESGCYQIFYGVESGSQRLLDLMKKGLTIEHLKQAFKMTKEEGIEALGSFILGLPTETPEESERTIDFALELDADFAHWELYTPHPGTNLFDIALQHGRLLTTDWNKFTTWVDEPVYLPHGRSFDGLYRHKVSTLGD